MHALKPKIDIQDLYRTVTSILLRPVILVIVYLGGWPLTLLIIMYLDAVNAQVLGLRLGHWSSGPSCQRHLAVVSFLEYSVKLN